MFVVAVVVLDAAGMPVFFPKLSNILRAFQSQGDSLDTSDSGGGDDDYDEEDDDGIVVAQRGMGLEVMSLNRGRVGVLGGEEVGEMGGSSSMLGVGSRQQHPASVPSRAMRKKRR